jgi:hypothetical protein
VVSVREPLDSHMHGHVNWYLTACAWHAILSLQDDKIMVSDDVIVPS